MVVFSLLTVLFCVLAVVLNAASIFVLLKKKAGGEVPVYSLVFAVFSFILLIAAALSCLLSAYTVMLPSALFLAAVCLILHFSTESAFAQEENQGEVDANFATEDNQLNKLSYYEDKSGALLRVGQAFIEHIAQAVPDTEKIGKFLDFANKMLIQSIEADGGVIFLVDDYDDILNSMALSGQFPPPYKLPDDLPLSQSNVENSLRNAKLSFKGNIFGEAALSGEPILISNAGEDSRIFANNFEDVFQPGSYIIVPLVADNSIIGVAGLSRLLQSKPFSDKDFALAKGLAMCVAASINALYTLQEIIEGAGLERESAVSAEIQKIVYPKHVPELPEIGFGLFFQPARGICSDYCDVITARRDRIALIIADVAGKGIISSMVMMSLRAILHLITNTTKSSSTIMSWLNKGITGRINIDHYATVSYISYSMETHEIEYSNAGHLPALVWRASKGRIEALHINSDPIGVERNSEYKEIKLTVAPGDIIILFTDGVIEALNKEGKQYGMSGLSRVISENVTASAKDIALAVKSDLRSFMGSAALYDDQTLLVMKIKGL